MSKLKLKGAYNSHNLDWNKDFSARCVPRAAVDHLTNDTSITNALYWQFEDDLMLFMLRAKVDRRSRLEWCDDTGEHELSRTVRYYVSTTGGELVKVMPPLKHQTEERRFAIQKGYKVTVCNRLPDDIQQRMVETLDWSWYRAEVEKLCLIM